MLEFNKLISLILLCFPVIVYGQLENKVYTNELFAIKFDKNQKFMEYSLQNRENNETVIGLSALE